MRNSKITGALVIVVVVLLLHGCKGFNANKSDTEDVAINPAFNQNPPLVRDLAIQKIKGNDQEVLLLVRFAPSQFKGQFLALENEGKKLLLRDDGKKGDEKADDGLFTTQLPFDQAELKELISDQTQMVRNSNGILNVFEGRNLIKVKLPKDLFTFKDFIEGKPYPISPFAPVCRTLPFDSLKVQKNCLMITDLQVVQDTARTYNVTAPVGQRGNPYGVWTFWELMRQLASSDPTHIATDRETSQFIRNWLHHWVTTQQVNGETVADRPRINLMVNQWSLPNGDLDPAKTPFRLIAIVNRIDLRSNMSYGTTGIDGGEGRFVFCGTLAGAPLEFTTIFEFGVNKTTCADVKNYAQQWWQLKDSALGTAGYNRALQAITDQFSKCGTNPGKPHQSSLNQLRTNEIMTQFPWELREFNLVSVKKGALLKEVTVKRTPAVKYNAKVSNADVKRLVTWVNANSSQYLLQKDNGIDIPETFPTTTIPFLGGHAEVPFKSSFWDGNAFPGFDSIHDPLVRHYFSLNTCTGCHAGETGTSFTHINPSPFGVEAFLSDFLTGNNMPKQDAANRPSPTPNSFTYGDLQRRTLDLDEITNCPCDGFRGLLDKIRFQPLQMEH